MSDEFMVTIEVEHDDGSGERERWVRVPKSQVEAVAALLGDYAGKDFLPARRPAGAFYCAACGIYHDPPLHHDAVLTGVPVPEEER